MQRYAFFVYISINPRYYLPFRSYNTSMISRSVSTS